MDYWSSLANDVLNKDKKNISVLLSDSENALTSHRTTDQARVIVRDFRTYYLAPEHPHIYFTKREAECAFWIVQHNTIDQAAAKMDLSPRTVEFYVKNMKLKLKCANKKQLIEKVLQSTLLKQLEKDGMMIVQH